MTPGVGRIAAAVIASRVREEWGGLTFTAGALDGRVDVGLAAAPRDFRPPDAGLGRAVLEGRFPFLGTVLEAGIGADPWDRPSPSRRAAVELHRFAWLPALLSLGEAGAREGLRLHLAWTALFGGRRPQPFAWGAEVLERRLFNLACGAGALAAVASEAEAAELARSLLHQARRLLRLDAGPARRAERLAAAATAAAALSGKAAAELQARALTRLGPALAEAVLSDGVLRTRNPEQGLELLFDLATLDDALAQRGATVPDALPRAADRLAGAVAFFRLGDGRMAALNGGGPSTPARLDAVAALTETDGQAYGRTPQGGYQRLEGGRLTLVLDAGPPAAEGWSVATCAQPLGFELSAGRDRLIGGAGWTPDAAAPAGLRLTPAGATLVLEGGSVGEPLTGAAARALGARLVEGPLRVEARRNAADGGVWLDLAHDGWVARCGLLHQRRLFLDPAADELRGEDRLTPAADVRAPRVVRPFAVAFHLAPGVDASVARDGRSLLLRAPREGGWRLRNDAAEATLEPTLQVVDGVARRGVQVVLRGETSASGEGRIRWKLSPVERAGRAQPAAALPELDMDVAPGREPAESPP